MNSEPLSFQEEEDQSGDVIMSDADIDPNYEPSEEEVKKYAIYLGMNLEEDKEFLHIAREGLKAVVPKPWRACQTRSGEIYYFNFETGDSQWDHPCDDLFRKRFQGLKALCNKGHHKREEQKLLKQLQNKQKVFQASQTLQANRSNRLAEADLNKFANTAKGKIEREDANKEFSQSFSKPRFLTENKKFNEHEDSGIADHSGQSEEENKQNDSQSFEHSKDFGNGETNTQRKASPDGQENLQSEVYIHEDSSMPETKNFYDEESIPNDTSVSIEENINFGKNRPFKHHDEGNSPNIDDYQVRSQSDIDEAEEEQYRQIKEQLKNSAYKNSSSNHSSKNKENNDNYGNRTHEISIFNQTGTNHKSRQSEENLNNERILTEGEGLSFLQTLKNKSKNTEYEEPEKDKQNQSGSRSQEDRINQSLKSHKNNNESLFKLEGTDKKLKQIGSINAIQELENEFDEILRSYEEELGQRFTNILQEYEQGYQGEASQIYHEYQDRIVEMRNRHEESYFKTLDSHADRDMDVFKSMVTEKQDSEMKNEKHAIQKDYEAKRRMIEKQEETETAAQLKRIKNSEFHETERIKQDLDFEISENADYKSALENLEKTTSRSSSQKNNATIADFEDEMRRIEDEENAKLEEEIKTLQRELDDNLMSEKTDLEAAYKQSQAEFKAFKTQMNSAYKKDLENEKNKLHKRHERAIRDLKKEELEKLEEQAIQNAYAKLKGEHDKKMNTLQVEKMLYDKQARKRYDEMQAQVRKKHELEKVNFENQKSNEIKRLTNEVDNLTNQVIIKDNQLANASRSIQEIESHEKEADERDDLINQLNSEIEELDNKGREIKSKINELQVELLDLKRKLITKNQTLNKINELHQQIDGVEEEISSLREKVHAYQKANHIDSVNYDTSAGHTSSNNINRLLREVEEIKSAVKKRAVKKSSSVSRMYSRNMSDLHNKTIDTTKIMSIIQTEPEAPQDGEEELPKSVLEENLDREPTLEVNRVLRRSHDGIKRAPQIHSTNRFLGDKRQKDVLQSYSQKANSLNYQDNYQRRRSDWRNLVETEKRNLEKLAYSLHQKKMKIRELQEQLKREQDQYKFDYIASKNTNNKSSTKKLQLEIFKKSLNDKIYDYNHNLCQMRDSEHMLKSKKDALKNLEVALNESSTGFNLSQSSLDELYDDYCKLDASQKTNVNKQNKNVERKDTLKERISSYSGLHNQGDTGRFNLNLVDILQRTKPSGDRYYLSGKDDSLKENIQTRANESDLRERMDNVSNSFQRKLLRKPSPSSFLGYGSHYESSKSSQDCSYLSKK